MPLRPATPSSEQRPTKKTRISSENYFEDLSKKVEWLDIERVLANTPEDETEPGWITGNVFMVFNSRQKSEAQLISRNMQLKITIMGPEYQRFKFSFRQSLRVSLRGASILKLKSGTSAPGYMPFSLVFKNGASIKFLTGEGNTSSDGMVVDSWQSETGNNESHSEEDWFQVRPTAVETSIKSCVAARASSVSAPSSSSHSSPFPETPGRNSEVAPYESSVTISNGTEEEELAMDMDIRDLAQDVPTSHEKTPPRQPDSGNRSDTSAVTRDRSRVKKKDIRYNRPRTVVTESSSDTREGESSGLAKELTTREKRRLKRRLTRKSRQTSREPPMRNPNLDLAAGLSTRSDAYPALTELLKNSFVHIVGVVACIEPVKSSRRGDFCLTLTLVDPSKFQNGAGFKVTLFMQAGFEYLLPSAVEKGHALLLRNVRTTEWMNNINGTVYPDRLKWIGYNPDTGKVYHPGVRSEENTSDCTFDALYLPKDEEMRYLVQLAGWWRAVKDEEERGAIDIGDYTRRRRDHRLIGSCDVDQFFNATVEVLRLEQAELGQTILFFTDYTPHRLRSTSGYYGQWAVHASTGMIDQSILDRMKPGTYWSIENMRLRIRASGSLEAELYAADLWERGSDADDVYLRELLKRKEAYLKEHPQNPGQYDTSESTISEISQTGHYNIIAELIYRSKLRDAVMDLFVTDYTDSKLLSSYKPEGLKRQLAGSPVTVLQITCWDGEEFVRDMEIGRIYSFCDVRIKEQDSRLKGNLKFVDKYITRMSVKKTDNKAVLALLRRKKEFEASVGGSRNSSLKSSEEQKPSLITSPSIELRSVNTIAEIKSAVECPKKFRLAARIVDFFPMDICDFAVRWCTNCMSRIPDNYNACVKCEDFMEEYVKWLYSFWFMLEDEKGERLIVDGGTGSKYFLKGLEPCDLRENHDALWALKRRLRGYLGNLVEVHEGLKREEVIEAQYAPYFDLAIRSWEGAERGDKMKFYALTGFEEVELSNHPAYES